MCASWTSTATDSNDHIFLENPQQVLRLPNAQQRSAGLLDLNYYLPCRVANREGGGTRTVAIIGLGRTDDGDFLSSEDMEVLGSLAGYIGIAIQNAQLYRRLEQKITEFERLKEFHENIVESIHVGIFAVDLEDRIESWNAQMEVMYAKSRGEALRQPLASIFPAEFMEQFDSVREEQGTHTFYKVRLALPTGETRVANIAIAPLLTRDFAVVGRIILVDDITERIELETQLTQAEKLSSIGLLAAGVAHEVNTPLAVISSYTQMLAKQMRPMMEQNARLAPVLEKITQQTFRASEIVNGLLNFSRTGGTEFASVDLNRLLHDTLTLLDHQFKTAQIRVETELDVELPRVHGNEGKLQQVVLNLLLNARDAMHGIDRRADPDCDGESGGTRLGGGAGFRRRDRAGASASHLRSVLHHQDQAAQRAAQGHGPGPGGELRHHAGACGQDACARARLAWARRSGWSFRRRPRRERRDQGTRPRRMPGALFMSKSMFSSRIASGVAGCGPIRIEEVPMSEATVSDHPGRDRDRSTLGRMRAWSGPARILIIDDEAAIRESLEALLTHGRIQRHDGGRMGRRAWSSWRTTSSTCCCWTWRCRGRAASICCRGSWRCSRSCR